MELRFSIFWFIISLILEFLPIITSIFPPSSFSSGDGVTFISFPLFIASTVISYLLLSSSSIRLEFLPIITSIFPPSSFSSGDGVTFISFPLFIASTVISYLLLSSSSIRDLPTHFLGTTISTIDIYF